MRSVSDKKRGRHRDQSCLKVQRHTERTILPAITINPRNESSPKIPRTASVLTIPSPGRRAASRQELVYAAALQPNPRSQTRTAGTVLNASAFLGAGEECRSAPCPTAHRPAGRADRSGSERQPFWFSPGVASVWRCPGGIASPPTWEGVKPFSPLL